MKIFIFVVLTVMMSIVLAFAGIPTPANWVLTQLGVVSAPQDFTGSNFFTKAYLIISAVAVVGIVVTFFSRSSPESVLAAPFVLILFNLVVEYASVITYMNSITTGTEFAWAGWIIHIIFAPLMVGYIIALIEWWRGAD